MLHKISKLKGFHLHATDGSVGHVDDFLVDPSWNVAYLVVDTSNWVGGKWVLISASAVQKINAEAREIVVGLTRDQIMRSPSVETADIELIETMPSAWIL